MNTRKNLHVLSVFLLLAVCLMGICSAAVSVDDVTSTVGPQVTLNAKVTDITATSYKWYTCDDASGTNPVVIEGATSASYTTDYLDVAGTTYYKVVVNDTESDVAAVIATMPTDYHVFKVNSVDDVKTYVGAANVPKAAEFVNINGVYAMQYNATKNDAATNFPISYINNIYLQAYPYLVFSLNYDGLTSTPSNFQIRSYTDRSINGNFHFQPAKSGFVKYVVNTATATYVGYDKNGKQVVSGGTYDGKNNAGKWKAKLTQLRLDFDVPAALAGQPIRFEYMGFFPTEAAAKAYAGEMPLDDKAEEILDCFDNATLALDIDEYATEDDIAAYVAKLAAEADAAVASIKAGGISNVTYSIENVTYTEGKSNNYYTFTVDVLVGDTSFKRSRIAREYTILVGDVNVPNKTVTVGPDATITADIEVLDSLTYQWYTCNADGSGAVAIEGATKPSYTRHVDEAGTTYYKLVVNGVKESNVAAFTAEMPKEPIVLKFNNKYDTAYWSTNLGYTKYLGVPVYQRAHAGNTNDDTTTITNIASYNVYLAAYPVIVVKSAYPDHPANNVDIYVGTDRDGKAPALNTGATTMHTHVGAEFVKLVFDSVAGNYKVYKADGTVSNQGNVKFGSLSGSRQGKLDYLRFDLSNGAANYQDVYYFEYVGFFPTVEMANAYTGAMPADEYSKVVISAFEDAEADDAFVMEYDQAMTEAKAEAFAKAKYDEISAEAIAKVKAKGINTVDVTYTAGKYTPYNPYGNFLQNGSYTFKVSVLAGDTPLQRSYLEAEVTVLLMGNQPNVFIEDITVPAGPQVTLTPEIIPGLEATSFQWYKCDDAEGTNPVAIEGAASETYTLYPLAGKHYYKVVVNSNESSNVMTVTGTLPDKPVIWRFNNETDIENWSISTTGGSDKDLVTYGGKLAYTYLPKNDGNTTFINLAKYNDFYLQGYPYIVISASYPDHAANATIDVYIGADGFDAEYRKNNYSTNFSVTGSKPAVNAGYSKTIIDLSTAKYKSYNENGALIRDAQADFGYMGKTTQNESLIGKLAYLRTDFSNNNAGKPCYIEYIGFFPTMEMALAYNGKMPNDEELASVVNILNTNGIKVPFAAAGTEATAAAGVDKYAKKAINAAISALESDCGSATVTVSNGVYSRPTKYGSGTYTADINIVLGDAPFGRSQVLLKDFVFTLTAKPEPVVMVFDTAEKVKAASISGYLKSKTFETDSERKFMRLVTTGTGDNYLDYSNIYEQTGNKIVPAEYPYMKMSYRRATPSSAGEGVQLYFANKSFYALYYPSSNYDNPFWEQLIVDMRNPKATMNYIREDGTSGRYANVQIYNNKSLAWDDLAATQNSDIEFRLTRYGSAARTLDYEYIGYFATEEEARLYPNAERHYDTEALKAANAFNAAEGVETQEQAQAAADAYLASLGFASKYTVENAVYTAPTPKATGSYVFDVWFGADKKAEYTVKVTMTIPALPFSPVAKIGDVEYNSLADAAAAAVSGDTIVLIDNIELTEDVTLPAGIKLDGNDKIITGATVWAAGDLTFIGHTTMAIFNAGYNQPTITIGAGASLETTSGRMVIGHGATFNITGTIADAKNTDISTVAPSLIAPGASFTGAGVNFNVTNAYVKFTAYCSSKNSNASETFNINVINSVWEQSGSLTFSVPTNGMDPTVNFNLKDSILNTASHLVFSVTKGEIVIDNSLVNNGSAKQLENRSNLTIKNGSVVYATVATNENAKNPGTLTVDNATYVGSGEFSGADVGTGTLIAKNNANVTLGNISKANVTVDTTSILKAGKVLTDVTFTVDATALTDGESKKVIDLTNTASVEGIVTINGESIKPTYDADGDVTVEKLVIVATIGEEKFESIQSAVNAASENDVITVIANVSDEAVTVDKSLTITGDATLNNVSITASGTTVELTVTDLTFTGSSYINANNAAALTVTGVNADVNPTKITGRAAFIVLGTSELTHGLKVTIKDNTILSAQSTTDGYSAAIFGWRYIADGSEISGNTFGADSDTERYTFIVVKTMNAMDDATITLANNTLYGTNNIYVILGFDLYQNNSRANAYTIISKDNVMDFAINAESIYPAIAFNISGNTAFADATNLTLMDNGTTVNGEALTLKDIDAADAGADYDKFYGVDVVTDESGAIVDGTFSANPALSGATIAPDLKAVENEDGSFGITAKEYVASVNDVKYESFAEAFANATDNCTITLLDNIALTERLDIADKALTINLGGKNITSTVDDSFGAIYVKKGATLTIEGEGNITSAGLTIGTYGTVNVNGGNIITESEDDASLYVFFYNSDFQGTATINGGALGVIWNCGNLTVNGGTVEYLDTSSELTISGGTITEIFAQDGSDADGAYEITITDPSAITVPEGFELKEIEAGKYQVVTLNYVAEIDGVQYNTLQAAFAAVPENTAATITLIDNFTIEGAKEGVIVINGNRDITLDLNGKTITVVDNATACFSLFYIGANTDAKMTVKDSAGNGAISLTATNNREFNASSSIFLNRGAILVIESGSYIHNGGTDMAFVVDNSANSYGDATTTINGGELTSTYIAIRNRMEAAGLNGTAPNGNGVATLTINGGKVNGTKRAIWGQVSSASEGHNARGVVNVFGGEMGLIDIGRNAYSDVMTTISGGTVSDIKAEKGELKISGGTLTGTLTILDASGNAVESDKIITGGTFSSDLSAFLAHGYKLFENNDGTFGAKAAYEDVADANGDGKITISDIIRILQYLAIKKR